MNAFAWFWNFIQAILILFHVLKFNKMNFTIEKTWDDQTVDHEPIRLELALTQEGDLRIQINAPFLNDPHEPNHAKNDTFDLWNYEVVEAFFLADSGRYLELEFGPFGHYLVLLLEGDKSLIRQGLSLNYTASISNNYWHGEAIIPNAYFPRKVTKMNAYAIHGSDPNRIYESLYAVPHGMYPSPDFHRLPFFKPIDFKSLNPKNWLESNESDVWKQ